MMKTRGMLLGTALILAGGFSVLAADDTPAATAIKKLADDAGTKDWAEFSKAGSEVAKKHELDKVMNGFKMRKPNLKGIAGIGVGAKPGAITPDGIEAKLISLTKMPLTPAQLQKEADDLVRMTEIIAAIAATSLHQCPNPAMQVRWNQWSEEMYQSSRELTKAIKAKNPADVKNAAHKLNDSCKNCH